MQSEISVKLLDIYNVLFAGKRISISFASSEDAESFRLRLHQYKKRTEDTFISLGMIDEKEVKRFSFRYDVEQQIATMAFVDKPDERQYVMTILEETEEKENGNDSSSCS